MKTVLLLTASTGGGHNQAAKALADIYRNHGYAVETLDIFKDSNEKLDALMVEGYSFLATKMPRTYGDLYWLSNKKIINKPLCDAIARRTWKSLHREIQRIQPALILSTHPFAVEIVAKIKRHSRLDCPYLAVVTDFIAHQTYLSPAVDGYIVGSQWTKKDLVNKGVEAGRIHALGIPTRKEFYQAATRPTQGPGSGPIRVLAMAGSLGLEEMADCLDAMIMDTSARVTAVCGNNQALYESLSGQFQKEIQAGRMTLYGFTKNIRDLMDSHDCIMTKPGGLTTTESILRQTPMLIPFMIPGQEAENTEFLVEEGMAIRVESPHELASQIRAMENQPHRLPLMRARMKHVADTYSPNAVFALSETLMREQEERIMIFSAGFGAGHQMVTDALREKFLSRYYPARIQEVDLMDWLTPQLSQSIYSGYQYLIKNYEALYNRYYNQVSQDDNTAQLLGRLIKRKTDKLIAKEMPSLLISTFPICTQVLGEWKENSGSQLPLITVITDVTSATEWLHPAVSHYLVASESVEKELIEKGVAPETISVTGIPVRRAFHRQTGKRLRTCHEPIRLLIMGGGMGLLPEDHTLYRWIQDDPSINATIITGHNHQAYKTLRSAYPALKVKGFVHDIAAEMNQADLLLSKPGGITLFEAIYTEIPILAYRPSLGQEQKNADFIEEKGIGQRVMATGEILKAIDGYRETYTLNRVHAQMESLHQELNQRNDQAFDQLLEKHVNG